MMSKAVMPLFATIGVKGCVTENSLPVVDKLSRNLALLIPHCSPLNEGRPEKRRQIWKQAICSSHSKSRI